MAASALVFALALRTMDALAAAFIVETTAIIALLVVTLTLYWPAALRVKKIDKTSMWILGVHPRAIERMCLAGLPRL